jgi:hypothetical protein
VVDGFELNISVLAAGPTSSLIAVALSGWRSLLERARPVDLGGPKALAASPEDLLLETALRPLREGWVAHRAVHDTRFLLEHDGESLDWDHILKAASEGRLTGSLGRMVEAAERVAGRELVGADVRAELAQAAGGRFDPFPGSNTGAAGWAGHRMWKLRTLGAEGGMASTAFHLGADPYRRKALARLARSVRSGRRSRSGAVPGRYRSVCELRALPAPAGLGRCLSREPSAGGPPGWLRGDARDALSTLERCMPDGGEEDGFWKRGVGPGRTGQAHRCEAFMVELRRRGA